MMCDYLFLNNESFKNSFLIRITTHVMRHITNIYIFEKVCKRNKLFIYLFSTHIKIHFKNFDIY